MRLFAALWPQMSKVERLNLAETGQRQVLTIVYFASFIAFGLLTCLLLLSFFTGNTYVGTRIVVAFVVLGYVFAIGRFIRAGRLTVAAWMTVTLYILVAGVILAVWGINVSAGILLLGFVVVVSGRILGARYVFPLTGLIIVVILAMQQAARIGLLRPDYSSLAIQPVIGDVAGYAVLFFVIALVSWVASVSLERALFALREEKRLLAVRLDERTRSLRAAQLEETRQLYRFAGLGQLSTVVLHDLANNLTSLTLDIDDLETQNRSSDALIRARESISYLDAIVDQARRQLRQNDNPEIFDALKLTRETVTSLEQRASRARVRLKLVDETHRTTMRLIGDPLRFCQVVTILTTNAIEAYDGPGEGLVVVTLSRFRTSLQIAVCDTGRGISYEQRATIFQPFHSTKINGMGIGLFISREIVERHFKGSIILAKVTAKTEFIVRLPEYRDAR